MHHLVVIYLIHIVMDTDEEILPHGAVIAIACAVTMIITAIVTFILTYIIVRRYCNSNGKHSSLRLSYESVWPLSYTPKRTDLEMQQNPACVTKHQVVIETNPAANDD